MSKRNDGQPRGQYTTEFKLEAVRLVKDGQSASVTAKVLGIPKQTLDNWVRLSKKGQLTGPGHSRGQTTSQKADEAARHQGQRQAQVCGNH